MGNESGEWIMHGMKWDNPDCIHSVDEAIKYINEIGFLPLFKNEIDGFSLEERTVPEYWWSDDPEIDPWMWRAIIARRHDIVYGKFFDKKAGFISKKWLATVYKGNIIKNLIMDCQSYTKYRPNETTGGIFVSWRRKEELPTGA